MRATVKQVETLAKEWAYQNGWARADVTSDAGFEDCTIRLYERGTDRRVQLVVPRRAAYGAEDYLRLVIGRLDAIKKTIDWSPEEQSARADEPDVRVYGNSTAEAWRREYTSAQSLAASLDLPNYKVPSYSSVYGMDRAAGTLPVSATAPVQTLAEWTAAVHDVFREWESLQ